MFSWEEAGTGALGKAPSFQDGAVTSERNGRSLAVSQPMPAAFATDPENSSEPACGAFVQASVPDASATGGWGMTVSTMPIRAPLSESKELEAVAYFSLEEPFIAGSFAEPEVDAPLFEGDESEFETFSLSAAIRLRQRVRKSLVPVSPPNVEQLSAELLGPSTIVGEVPVIGRSNVRFKQVHLTLQTASIVPPDCVR